MFITLGPVLNVRWMAAAVFAERYLYMPSIGYCWLIGWVAVALWSASRPVSIRAVARAVPMLLGAVAILYAVKTVARNRDWRSEDILFAQTLKEQPDSTLILADVGTLDFGKGDFAAAEHEWLESLAAGPENVFALDNLALLRRRQRRYDESLDYSWRALRARPAYTMGHLNLAETLAELGHNREAEWQFRVATAISPLSTRAHNEYGKFLFDANRQDDARAEFELSAQIDPTSEAYDRLGDIYLVWKDFPRAENAYRHDIALNPFDSHAHVGLGQVLEFLARPGDALHEYETGLQTDPTDRIAKAALVRLRRVTSERTITQ
jgi:tetratricopeptide (TPR) repeat protein